MSRLISSHLVMISDLEEGARLVPLALLVEVLHTLVDHELPVLGARDAQPLERPRRRTLEVDARLVEAAAVAGALELVLGREPARRAAEMRALGEQRVDALLRADDPDALVLLVLLADLADHVVGRKPGLEARGWLEEHAREGRADDAEQRDAGERAEDAPGEAAEDIAARPQGPELGALPGALLALQALLLTSPGRESGFVLGAGLGLSHRWWVPFAPSCRRAATRPN